MKHTVLVVEDESSLVYILQTNLKREGYNVLAAKNAEKGLQTARAKKPDLILLDIMLGGKMDGLEMLRLLRQESQVPVLFLTAKKSEVDRVLGFKLGADDYITKPFSVAELLARVKAVLHRASGAALDSKSVLKIGAMEIDFDRRELKVDGKPRSLTPREFQLLKLLVDARGKILSRDHLLEQIWGYDKSMNISTRTVDQHIARLRRKLLSEKGRISTVTNAGYKLTRD